MRAESVLRGHVPRDEMERRLDVPRLVLLERDGATLPALRDAIRALRAEHPGEPVLVAIDYVQIMGDPNAREIRARIAVVIQEIDDLAREHRAVVIAVSQMSRSASRNARNGE